MLQMKTKPSTELTGLPCIDIKTVNESHYIRAGFHDNSSAVQSEKGVSFGAIKNFQFEKNKKMYFGVFLKHYLLCITLNNMKFYTFIKSFIIYLMM